MLARHTAFLRSLETGDFEKIRSALKNEKHRTIFHSLHSGVRSLHHKYIQPGESDSVYETFLNYVNCSFRNVEHGETALQVASEMGDIAIVHYLLLKGAEPNVTNKINQTAIMFAAYFGHHNIVEHLAHLGGDIHLQESKDGNTALLIALQQKQWKVAMSLIELGAKVNFQNNEGRTPLMEAAKGDEAIDVIQTLLRKGADIYKHDQFGRTALMQCVLSQNIAAMQLLLNLDAHVDSKARDGTTALMLAATSKGSILMLKLLIKYGAKLDSRNINGYTALTLAVIDDRVENAKCLLEHGADATKRNRDRKVAQDYISSEKMRQIFEIYAYRSPSRVAKYKVPVIVSPYSQNSPKKSSSRLSPQRGFSNSR